MLLNMVHVLAQVIVSMDLHQGTRGGDRLPIPAAEKLDLLLKSETCRSWGKSWLKIRWIPILL